MRVISEQTCYCGTVRHPIQGAVARCPHLHAHLRGISVRDRRRSEILSRGTAHARCIVIVFDGIDNDNHVCALHGHVFMMAHVTSHGI